MQVWNENNTISLLDSENMRGFHLEADTETLLNRLLQELRSPIPQSRVAAQQKLKLYLNFLSREATVEQLQSFVDILNQQLRTLIVGANKASKNDKITTILLIDVFIDFYSRNEQLPNYIAKLGKYLRILVPSTDTEVRKLAASTLGKLALPGLTVTSEFVEQEMKICIEWLTTLSSSNNGDSKRHAALLIITSLAKNAPYVLFPYVNSVLDNIWNTLRDSEVEVRFDASFTLLNCLRILETRDPKLMKNWYQRLITECLHELSSEKIENIHGSLLSIKELLRLDNSFLDKQQDVIFNHIIKLKNHRSAAIREEIYCNFPLLAAKNPHFFAENYLSQVMVHLLSILRNMDPYIKRQTDEKPILICIADIATQVKSSIAPYLNSIFEIITSELRLKAKNRTFIEEALFYSIGKLTFATGPKIYQFMNDSTLDLIFNYPFSKELPEVLQIIFEKCPTLEPPIKRKLLDTISNSLTGGPFAYPGSPISFKDISLQKARTWRNKKVFSWSSQINDDINDCQLLLQSFAMLSAFTYDVSLSDFVRFVTVEYLEHDEPNVREQAAITSCDLLVRDNICKQTSQYSLNCVSEVLSKLLVIAVTDPLATIRLSLLEHLKTNFDPQLAQQENTHWLFTLLNDESFPVKLESMKIIGRLSQVNPAYVIPFLRKILLDLLMELKYTTQPRRNEEIITLLCALIASSNNVSKDYIEPILESLLPKVNNTTPVVTAMALRTIGSISIVGGEKMNEYRKELMPLLINTLQDQSQPFKREAALKALGEFTESAGYVIDPLLDYPPLLNILMNILKTDNSQNIRREVIRTIGILGALDPYRYREVEVTSNTTATIEQNAPSIDISLLMKGVSTSNEEYSLTVVFNNLIKLLKDPSLSSHFTAVTQAIIHIFQIVQLRCVPFLEKIVPCILHVIEISPQSLTDYYFQQIAELIITVGDHIRPHVDRIFESIQKFFPTQNLQLTLLNLIQVICEALGSEFKIYVPRTLTLFLAVLTNDSSTDKIVSIEILKTLTVINTNLEDCSHLILPTVIKLCEYSSGRLKETSIIVLGKLIENINSTPMASRIMQALLRNIRSGQEQIIQSSMNTMCILLLKLGTDFAIFIPVVNKTLVRNKIHHTVYDQLVEKILNNEPLPETVIMGNENSINLKNKQEPTKVTKKLTINQPLLKSTWDCSQLATREDWEEWLRRLSIQILKESPSQASFKSMCRTGWLVLSTG